MVLSRYISMIRSLLVFFTLVIPVLQENSSQEELRPPREKAKSVTILAGGNAKVLDRAIVALDVVSKTRSFSNVSLHCSKELPDQVIAVFNSGFALQTKGEVTIQPLIASLDVDQVIFWYESNATDLNIADLARIAALLPRKTQLPPGVEFFIDYSDPLTLGTNHTTIITDRTFLAFLTELSDIQNIKVSASVGVKDTESTKVGYLMFVEFHEISDDDLYRIELKKGVVSGKTALFITSNDEMNDRATKFLYEFRDSLKKEP